MHLLAEVAHHERSAGADRVQAQRCTWVGVQGLQSRTQCSAQGREQPNERPNERVRAHVPGLRRAPGCCAVIRATAALRSSVLPKRLKLGEVSPTPQPRECKTQGLSPSSSIARTV